MGLCLYINKTIRLSWDSLLKNPQSFLKPQCKFYHVTKKALNGRGGQAILKLHPFQLNGIVFYVQDASPSFAHWEDNIC